MNHRFGGRDALLEALLRRAGRRLRQAIATAATGAVDRDLDIGQLVTTLADVYSRGYGELALALHPAGRSDDGAGLLDDLVDALHTRAAGR